MSILKFLNREWADGFNFKSDGYEFKSTLKSKADFNKYEFKYECPTPCFQRFDHQR